MKTALRSGRKFPPEPSGSEMDPFPTSSTLVVPTIIMYLNIGIQKQNYMIVTCIGIDNIKHLKSMKIPDQ